ncbi:transposase [Vibrio variabilis]
MTKRTRRALSPEFKLEAAQLVTDQGYTVVVAAKSKTLRSWR